MCMPPAPCSTGSTTTAAISPACSAYRLRVVRSHATSSGSSAGRSTPAGRAGREDLLGQHSGEERVHPADRVADAHRRERVAVVAAADGEHPPPRTPGSRVHLPGHLERHLDRHRAGVGEEHVLQPVGRELQQPSPQRDGRLVGEAAEHHVAHPPELAGDRRVELGHGVAVDRAPPRRHRVDDLTGGAVAVAQPQPHPGCRLDQVGVGRHEGRGVRVPEMVAIEGQQFVVRRVLAPSSGMSAGPGGAERPVVPAFRRARRSAPSSHPG